MKFFENLSTYEQQVMLRKTVAFSNALEGMDESADKLLAEAKEIESQQRTKLAKTLDLSTPSSM